MEHPVAPARYPDEALRIEGARANHGETAMTAISLNMMRRVVEAGDAVPRLLEQALPGITAARTKLDDLTRLVGSGTAIDDVVMDTPWAIAANARGAVRGEIDGVQRILGKVESGTFNRGMPGPPSAALDDALDALDQLDLAQTFLGKTLRPWVGEFGGSHAVLNQQHVASTAEHLGRAERLIQSALRNLVNDAAIGAPL
jgi:hypothetical protein